jgi:hypothetical protein
MSELSVPDLETQCPRPNCEGNVYFWNESSESYTNNGLSIWAHNYLVMDGSSCTEGHRFDEDEVKKMEAAAIETSQDEAWRYD